MPKTIAIEQLGGRVSDVLEQQGADVAIPLTKGGDTVAWVLKVPTSLRASVAGPVVFSEGPGGQVIAVVQAAYADAGRVDGGPRTPVFGAGRGTLTMLSDDEDHLLDFQEYME